MRRSIYVLLGASLLACTGSSKETTAPDDRAADSKPKARADFGPWTATVDAEHPLVGTAWSTADQRTLTRAEIEQRIADARFVLLGEQVVLVAGTGHTRDVAVPRLLQIADVPEAQIVNVAFVAVDGERLEAHDYGDDHDILVFTPGIEREDPCAAMRAAASAAE
jgi:hypothetical protein